MRAIGTALIASLAISSFFVLMAKLEYKDTPWGEIIMHRNMARGILYGFLLFLGNGYLSKWVSKKYPLAKDFNKKMIAFYSISILLTTIVVFFVNALFSDLLFSSTSQNLWQRFDSFIRQQHIVHYFQIAFISYLISFVFFGFYFFKKFKDYQIRETMQENQHISAQFESLKSQLDPHFLFNSLNVLKGLIEEDTEKAGRFTTDLAVIYRYVLEQKDKNLVSLHEELAFSKSYLSLLSLRFEGGMTIQLPDANPECPGKILPLSLQLLIENVIKHNIISLQKPLTISIYQSENYLFVENNLQKKNTASDTTGIGLKNIKDRYLYLSALPLTIEETPDLFRVGIPIITI